MGNLLSRRNREFKLLMVGLDQAGKTTVLYFLKCGEIQMSTAPTIGFNVETISHQGCKFEIWDISGKEKIRRMWKHYYKSTDGIIFVVDSTDCIEERIEECKEALSMFTQEELLKGCSLLVLANKQDLPEALSVEEVAQKLGLESIQDRRWHIQGVCAVSGVGLYEGLDWLYSSVTGQKKT